MSRIDDIENRHAAWYSGDDTTAEWPDDLSFVESYEHDRDSTPRTRAMAHEITREDVPFLLEAVKSIRFLHRSKGLPYTLPHDQTCAHCGHPWPCPTIRALEA